MQKPNLSHPRKISILGSTGTIGQTALEIIAAHPDLFEIVLLSAHQNVGLFAQQVKKFKPRFAVLTNIQKKSDLERELGSHEACLYGEAELCRVIESKPSELVLAAIVGIAGLRPVLSALSVGTWVALANKESLVAGGPLVRAACEKSGARLIPVDSEHSAIFQLLHGQATAEIKGITLTASGGPFFRTLPEKLRSISPQEAVKHPKWNMGAKVSVDSATLVNKALELIEAHWLFGCPESELNVVIHPQSIIHSFVELIDGTTLAQLSTPDMKIPIAFALTYPEKRLGNLLQPVNMPAIGNLEFCEVDNNRFPAIALAKECIKRASSQQDSAMSAIMNAANEWAVWAFLQGKITFDRIVPTVMNITDQHAHQTFSSLDDLLALHAQVLAQLEQSISQSIYG